MLFCAICQEWEKKAQQAWPLPFASAILNPGCPGICGGAPSPSSRKQIYLGDVVISDSVVAYDFGRQYPGGFRRKTNVKDTLGRPDREIRTLLAALKATRSQIEFQDQMLENLGYLQEKETR